MRSLVWTYIGEDSVRYRKNNLPLAIPLTAKADSKIIIVKFPIKINFDLVSFEVWNGAVRKTYCDKGRVIILLKVKKYQNALRIQNLKKFS